MLKKIESIRKKPKEVRNRYAFWYAFGFTMIIASFWLMSMPSRLSILTNVSTEEEEKTQGGLSRSFSDLRASLSEGAAVFKDLKESATTVEGDVLGVVNEELDTGGYSSTSESGSDTGMTTVDEVEQPEPVAKQVLIGTSSSSVGE